MTGQTISHYRVLEKLGEGGMGMVYKAEDTKLRRAVALKFLPPDNRDRFLREAQAAAALNHPNICTVFEIDEEHGFLAMELIDGMSVKDKIAARPLPLEEALDIAQQATNQPISTQYGEFEALIEIETLAIHRATCREEH